MALRRYDKPGETDEDHCVIVIPCYHPRAGRYGSFKWSTFAYVFTYTVMIAWVVVGWAMKLEQGSMTKSQFLSRVMEKPAEQVGDGTPFRRAFRKARSDLQVSARRGTVSARKYTPGPAQRQGLRRNHIKDNDRIWGKAIERPSYDSINFFVDQDVGDAYTLARAEAWELAKLELEMIMECGWAQCASQSLERNLQTIGIARKHYGVLYTSERKTSMQVRAWMGKVEQGRSYYFEAAGLDEQLLGP